MTQFTEAYKRNFKPDVTIDNDFDVYKITPKIYIGLDKNHNIAVILESTDIEKSPIIMKTKKVNFEINIKANIEILNNSDEKLFHIIKCLSELEKEKLVFLDLCEVLFSKSINNEEYLFETIKILSEFFSQKIEFSNSELQGIYAELYTIYFYQGRFNFGEYWQTSDRMKFDFSITSKTKVEVKSTLKPERKHHFRHDQLAGEIYNIYVLSYMLRPDDEGLSLLDLIIKCKDILADYQSKIVIIQKILNDVSEERLKEMKFNVEYLNEKMRFFDSKKIPRFEELSPNGIVNAEYDCILEGIENESEEIVIERLNELVNSEDKNYV